ncbi:MAG: membrane protein insertase YidC [Alphaproteobacteria bacterium]|nr:membrane protein insertase YidC [Alphaproteobacteria bacterium]
MMQQKDQMHPQDMRNLILFGVLSILLWLSYDHFILKPKMEKMRAAAEIAEKVALENQTQEGMKVQALRPRAEVISETQKERIALENDFVKGSINLKGARLDDLALTNHFKTIARQENAVVLSPAGSSHPKYTEHGWVASDRSLKMPDNESVWTLSAGEDLAPDSPVALQWSNGQGLTFERVIELNEDYGFHIVQRVINNTGSKVELHPYALVVQRGIPEDYLGRWVVHEGPIGYIGTELIEEGYGKMEGNPTITQTAKEGWIGLTSKNWLTALVPDQKSPVKYRITYTKAARANVKDRYQADMMGPTLSVPVGGMSEFSTHLFAGAKKLDLLEKYEKEWDVPHFDLAVDFGLFYFLTRPFFAIINFFYGLVGNFGVAIIMFTVVLRICVFPLANTSYRSFAKLRQLGPQMNELRDKYKDEDKQKLQQELVKLYQKEKVNPAAGCLPILIQIPIFFSLFKVLSNTIEMRHAPFFGWIQDLSAPDPTSIFNLFGLIPWNPPGFLMIGVWPCLMLLTMIVQRKLSPPPTDKMQAQIIAAMPWLMTFILAQFAAGLVIYWTFNNLLAVIQQYVIMRMMGVEVDLVGNFLGKNKDKEMEPVEGIHPEAKVIEENVETALGIDQEDTPENAIKRARKKAAKKKPISKPKPKKKKPTQKKKK